MTYVALTAIAALIVTSLLWAGLTRNLIRQQARERGLILDQMMHLAGRTWTPPPAAEPDPEPEFAYADPAQNPDWA